MISVLLRGFNQLVFLNEWWCKIIYWMQNHWTCSLVIPHSIRCTVRLLFYRVKKGYLQECEYDACLLLLAETTTTIDKVEQKYKICSSKIQILWTENYFINL